jgi:hypothetical protein
VGDSSHRLNAAYRRRYGDLHAATQDVRALVPVDERDAVRETGRRLVDALVRYLDGTATGRVRAEAEALELAALLGDRMRRYGVPLEAGVSMFVAARRPFLAELRLVARRSGVNAVAVGQLYDMSIGLLDRLLLAFVAAHVAPPEADERLEAAGAQS